MIGAADGASEVLSAADLAELIGRLQRSIQAGGPVDDVERIDRITQFERLKSVAAAGQAVETAAFIASRDAQVAAAGKLSERKQAELRRDIRGQVALARRDSPHAAGRHVGVASALVREMPHTMDALLTGDVSEWRATIVVQESATLTAEHRRQLDAELAGRLATMGDKAIHAAAATIAYRLDAQQAVKRAAKARSERCVTLRPAPATMGYLTALLPIEHAVAVRATLEQQTATAKALGDPRSRGQLMADALVVRLIGAHRAAQLAARTGGDPAPFLADATHPDAASEANALTETVNAIILNQLETATAAASSPSASSPAASGTAASSSAASGTAASSPAASSPAASGTAASSSAASGTAASSSAASGTAASSSAASGTAGLLDLPAGVGLDIQLIITDRTLFDGDDEPAVLSGVGPIPAPLARHLVRCADPTTKTWVRRLYTDPHTGNLTGADTRRRLFPPAARQFLITRDQVCRNTWCGAPIRHADHITPYAATGVTDLADAQGLCEHCNQVKENPGWQHKADPDGSVTVTTPTGHRYRNTPPRPPRSEPWAAPLDPPLSGAERILHHHLAQFGTITWVSPPLNAVIVDYDELLG